MIAQHFSTSTSLREPVPKAARMLEERSTKLTAWSSFVDQNVCAFTYQAEQSDSFSVEARARTVATFTVARLITSAGPAQMQRGTVDIGRDNRACYAFYVPIRGFQEIRQFNRADKITSGSFTLISTSEPFLQSKPGDNDTMCLLVASDSLDSRALRIEDHCARCISAEHGLPRLFCDSLIALEREAFNMDDEQFLNAAHSVSELGLLSVATSADMTSHSHSVRSSSLANAKRVIRRRLTDPDLTLHDIARECGLSLRYLHKLFREEGRTMHEYLTSERLQHARNLLRYAPAAATVTGICFASGFSNTSRFSTAFRKAFAVSPSEVLGLRKGSRRGSSQPASAARAPSSVGGPAG